MTVDFVHDVIAWKRDGKELDEARVRALLGEAVSGGRGDKDVSAVAEMCFEWTKKK